MAYRSPATASSTTRGYILVRKLYAAPVQRRLFVPALNPTTMASPQVRFKPRLLETPAAEPSVARAHFESKLAFETDPSDVRFDQQNSPGSCVVVDTRSPESFANGHVPSALNIPYRTMDANTTSKLDKNTLVIAYCTSVACNASTKGAARLSALGFRVKEMLGGIEAWQDEGYPVEKSST